MVTAHRSALVGLVAALQICAAALVISETSDSSDADIHTWTSGNCTITLDTNDGIMTVAGNGPMGTNRPWDDYSNTIITVVIDTGVTTISDFCCYNYPRLTSVSISDTVTSIGEYAFANDSLLKSVMMGASVASIGEGAFSYTGLTSLVIPDSLTNVGETAFNECTSLTTLFYFGTTWNLTTIGQDAFSLGNSDHSVVCNVYSTNNIADEMLNPYTDQYTSFVYSDIPECTVTILVNNPQYGTVSRNSIIVPYGTAITANGNVLTVGAQTSVATAAPATVSERYSFLDWLDVPESGAVTEDITIVAYFRAVSISYTVTILPNYVDYGTVSRNSIIVPYGTAITANGNVLNFDYHFYTVTATPESGCSFIGWSGIPESGAVTEDITITASFAFVFAVGGITYTGDGGASVIVTGLDGFPASFTLAPTVDFDGATYTVASIASDAFSGVTLQDHDNLISPAFGQHFVRHDGIYWLDGWHPNPNYISSAALLIVIPLLIVISVLLGAVALLRDRY